MSASGAIQPAHLHRRHGKFYFNLALLASNVDLLLDSAGVPDATQNPNAFFVGATDGGYEFSAEPTFYEEVVDEEDSPIEVGIESIAAQISFRALQVLDLETISEFVPFGTYSTNTVSGIVTERITAGGDRLMLPAAPCAVVSPAKDGSFIGVYFYAGYNSGAHMMQFKKTDRSGMDMVVKALSVPGRADGDRLYRVFRKPAPAP